MAKLNLKVVGDVIQNEKSHNTFRGKLAGEGDRAKQIDFTIYVEKDGDEFKTELNIPQRKELEDLGIELSFLDMAETLKKCIHEYKLYLSKQLVERKIARANFYDNSRLHSLLKEIKKIPGFQVATFNCSRREYIDNDNCSLYLELMSDPRVQVHMKTIYSGSGFHARPNGEKFHLEVSYKTITLADKVSTVVSKLRDWHDSHSAQEVRKLEKAAEEKELLKSLNKMFGKVTQESQYHSSSHSGQSYSTPYFRIHIEGERHLDIDARLLKSINPTEIQITLHHDSNVKLSQEQIWDIVGTIAEGSVN
jgi:hypothetical protein